MSRYLIRLAEPQDHHRVGELLVDAFVTRYREKMPEVVVSDQRKQTLRAVAEKQKQATVFVLLEDDFVIGTVALFKPESPDSEAWIDGAADLRHLAIDPKWNGKGLSKLLIAAVEKEAQDWGIDYICLHVRRGADGIARLYERHGFIRDESGDIERPDIYLMAFKKRVRA